MAMGTRKQREKQEGIWIAQAEMASAVREVLCAEVRAAVADAGDLLSVFADWIFRGHRR